MHTLISATPSPYARKVRIALAEKGIPFTLQTEVPWDSTTKTPQYNPLEKLPVLILDPENLPREAPSSDGLLGPAIYESHFILSYLETYYNPSSSPPFPSLLPHEAGVNATEARLFAQQVEVVCDGICDALVLAFWEKNREEAVQSQLWIDRQMRKVDGGLRALEGWVKRAVGIESGQGGQSENGAVTNGKANGYSHKGTEEKYPFLINNTFSLADIAIGCVCGYLAVRWKEHPWQERHPTLAGYWRMLEERESFKETVPSPQVMKDRIV